MSSTTDFFGQIAVSTLPSGVQAAYTFKNSVDRMDTTVTAVKVEVKDKQGLVASWGKNNDYPQKVMEAVRLNATASSGLRFMRKAHYGNGVIFVKDEVDDNGKKAPKVIPLFDLPDQFAFFQKSQMSKFNKEVIADLEYFSIAFPEYILSENGKTINRVKRQKAAWCRFEIMNEESGLIENIYISEKFGKGGSVDLESSYVSKVPVVDSYWSAEEVKAFCLENGIKKFIRPIFYPLIDEAYYPESEWHSVIKSGWMEVSASVPALKKALFNNQMTIKYIIEIDERYFEKVYAENWQKMSVEERINIRKKLIDDINDSLVGNDKAGKSIQSMKILGNDGKTYPAVTITAIDDKFKDGSYLPEAEAANSETLVAIGVDASLIGGAGIPGGKVGAGSGSDKRVAFDVLNSLLKTNRETALEPYDFIAQFNGWDTTIRASFETIKIETLDKNPTGTTNTTA